MIGLLVTQLIIMELILILVTMWVFHQNLMGKMVYWILITMF